LLRLWQFQERNEDEAEEEAASALGTRDPPGILEAGAGTPEAVEFGSRGMASGRGNATGIPR